jgi:hypothetical protein
LGLQPAETTHGGLQLPGHVNLNYSSAQSAEIIAEHFSRISQEYSSLDITRLPPNVQACLANNDQSLAPVLSVSDVKSRIIKANKPNGLVPGDLPKKVIQTWAGTLASPVSMIYNQITQCAVFPTQWKIEHQIDLPKVSQPETEDQLRNIAKTPFISKVYESFV